MFYPYIVEGGLIWMLPIVFLSFLALALCLERSWYWFVQYLHSRHRDKILKKMFQSSETLRKSIDYCNGSKDPLIMTLREFLVHYQEMTLEMAERKACVFAEAKVQESRSFLDWLTLIASISGTLGLFGTVVGISICFKTLAQADSKGMALALATALYTTVAGIILFFIAYLCSFFFQKCSDRMENDMDLNIQKAKDMLELEQKSKLVFTESANEHSKPKKECVISEEEHTVIKEFADNGAVCLEPSLHEKEEK